MRHPSPFVARLRAPTGDRPARGVLTELRRAVLSGDAPPGTAIPLREVAEAFGVSSIPVREALQVLVGEGLVVHRANAGYTVARLSRGELAELYVVRGALEGAALRAAAPLAGDGDVAAARAALDALRACLSSGDSRLYHERSRAFHVALMAPAGMPRLLGMVESAWNLTEPAQPMRYSTWQARERCTPSTRRCSSPSPAVTPLPWPLWLRRTSTAWRRWWPRCRWTGRTEPPDVSREI